MKRFVQSFPFLMVFGVCMHVACGDADNGTDTTGVGPVGAQGTGYHPACNLDRRDGYCNILGQNPETCECFDCAQAAKCRGKCVDDGTCDYDPEDPNAEDCTCGDCNPGPNCAAPDPDTSSPASTTASSVASTSDTVATTDAATTDAATTAATTGGMGGAGGN